MKFAMLVEERVSSLTLGCKDFNKDFKGEADIKF
jgi:hypothetical protein